MIAFLAKWKLWLALAGLLAAFLAIKASRGGKMDGLVETLRDRLLVKSNEERLRKSEEASEKYHDTVDSGLADWIDGMLG